MDKDIEEASGLLNPHERESGDPLRVFICFPLKFPKNIPLTLFNVSAGSQPLFSAAGDELGEGESMSYCATYLQKLA